MSRDDQYSAPIRTAPRSTTARPHGGQPRLGARRLKAGRANCTAAWTLVGVLLVYKVVTIVLIYVAASASNTAGFLLLATNWIWLIVLGIFLSVLPFAFWFRLLRARSRRAQLRRSEWEVS